MKRWFLFVCLVFVSTFIVGQSTNNKLAVYFTENSSPEQRQAQLSALGAQEPCCSHFISQPITFVNCENISASAINSLPAVKFVSTVQEGAQGFLGATNGDVFVVLKAQKDEEKLQALVSEMDIEYSGANEFLPHIIKLKCNKNTTSPELVVEELTATKLFKLVVPGVWFTVAGCTVNDTYYDRQWSLKNTGTPLQGFGTIGADIDAELAWEITTGSPDITIAVLDSGIDTLHPDLSGNLLAGYDAMGTGTNGYPTPNYAGDGHGTCCAGIAAATTNNNTGIAGVCRDCKIVPIKMFAYENIFGNILPFSNAESFINGISWQWQVANVDVSSNSWGLTDEALTYFPGQDLIANEAIDAAVANGREGLGLSMIFSSGNTGDVDLMPIWPSRNWNTVAVNATSMCDERKSFDSCDNEGWEGNWGANLDVSAPGVRISTTDMLGPNGYSGSGYTHSFNGTSASCPIVAGIAGLILSEYPNLTRAQLEGAIKRGCEKVGGYDYNLQLPEGTWCPETGYGRVNAFNSLQEAGISSVQSEEPINYSLKTLTDKYQIVLGNGAIQSYFLYNLQGQLIESGGKQSLLEIEFGNKNSGLYLLQINSSQGFETIKLIIP